MKLRFQSNSIRLRLKRGEVDRLAQSGNLEEAIVVGTRPSDVFRYVLESSAKVKIPSVHLQDNRLLVQVPLETVLRWAGSGEVGIEAHQPAGELSLHVLIEKDFACLDRSDEDNVDTFPHPLAGAKC